MMRPFDWQERMIDAINARRDTPFAWGRHDCALFACDVAQAICGVDFAAGLRGRYATERGAYVALKRFAGPNAKNGGLEAAAEKIAANHGCPEVPPLMAQRGDIVLMDSELGAVLGVCVGETIAKAGVETGVEFVPLAAARRAWRVP